MHFPDSMLPPVPPTTDRTEISPKAATSPTRKVVPGLENALSGGQGGAPGQAGARPRPQAEAAQEHLYQGENRRLMCRRIYHIPVLLDTRSGEDRRRHGEAGDPTATHLDQAI